MKTSYKKRFIPFHTGKGKISVCVNPGQFVFGRNRAAEFLGDSPSTVWKRIKKLEAIGNISIESNRQYSIITICNWLDYQEPKEEEVTSKEQAGDKQVTTEEQLSDTNKKVKKVKNVKNVKKKTYGAFSNVLLTDVEFSKLKESFNGTLENKIEELSEGIASKGYKYQSHYATILSWNRKKQKENPTKKDNHNGFDKRDYQAGATKDADIPEFLRPD